MFYIVLISQMKDVIKEKSGLVDKFWILQLQIEIGYISISFLYLQAYITLTFDLKDFLVYL